MAVVESFKGKFVLPLDEVCKDEFTGVEFLCKLVEFHHTRTGDTLLKVQIPYQFRDKASEFRNAYGIMLKIECVPWGPEAKAAYEAKGSDEDVDDG